MYPSVSIYLDEQLAYLRASEFVAHLTQDDETRILASVAMGGAPCPVLLTGGQSGAVRVFGWQQQAGGTQ